MRAFIGKSLSYGLYRFGIVEAEGMKEINGIYLCRGTTAYEQLGIGILQPYRLSRAGDRNSLRG